MYKDKAISTEDKTPIPRKELDHSTEGKDGDYFTPVNPEKKIGVAIVGLGNLTLGQIMPAFGHCKYIRPVALVSGDPDKAKKLANQYGINEKNIYNYENFDRIKDNKEIDAVYIILPNHMHHEFTIRAARAGKHVLCEKPMANSLEECQEMIEACKKADRKLMIAYRIQYEPNNLQCREWIQKKEYGDVKVIEMYNGQNIGDPSQWRLKVDMAGGGPLVDIGIYCVNTCRFLLAEEPEAVFAKAFYNTSDERFKEVEESILFHMYFPSGVVASGITTYNAHVCRRYRVFTNKGTWFGMDPAFQYEGLKIEISQQKDAMEWKSYPSIPPKNQFALEMDHFAMCIVNDKQPFTPGEEGWQDQRIIEALYRSIEEEKVVYLEKITEKDYYRGVKPDKVLK